MNENAPTNTIVAASIPFSVDYDALPQNGQPPVDVDIAILHHEINPAHSAGGRFTVVQNGVDGVGNPVYQLLVSADNDAGTTADNLDYEVQDAYQIVDNQYQVVINSYSDTPANGGQLLVSRQFTIFLNDLNDEGGTPPATNITWNGVPPAGASIPGAGDLIATLTSDAAGGVFALGANSDPRIAVSADGQVTASDNVGQNQTRIVNLTVTNAGGTTAETVVLRTGSNSANVMAGVNLDDIIYGRAGNDSLTGLAGDDVLYGQTGDDTLDGGIGNDVLVGGRQSDVILGGIGNDLILHEWGDGFDTIDGGEGFDTVMITGSSANQNLVVSYAGGAISSINNIGTFANIEAIHADMGGSDDQLNYTPDSDAVTVDLLGGTASGFASIANIRDVSGTGGGDTITTGTGENRILAGNGDDTVIVAADDVVGILHGQGGLDTVDYSAYAANLTVTLQGAISMVGGSGTSSATSDTLQSFENFIGGSGTDIISGSFGTNVLKGGGGNDILFGDRGGDTLTGGGGNDVFVFTANNELSVANHDFITDFEGAGVAGGDIIDLSGYGGTFFFIGSANFNTGNQNQVRYAASGDGNTVIQIDTNNNTNPEAEIWIAGVHTFIESDFVLA